MGAHVGRGEVEERTGRGDELVLSRLGKVNLRRAGAKGREREGGGVEAKLTDPRFLTIFPIDHTSLVPRRLEAD